MLLKSFTLRKPVDNYAVQLELFLSTIAKDALQSASGFYTATGKKLVVTIPFYPKIIVISPFINIGTASATTAGNMVFSLTNNLGISYIPGTGFVKDCVTDVSKSSFTLGINTAVNNPAHEFVYFVIG